MRKFCFLAVAAAVLALATADQAQAGGRRTRYYSYGGTSATVSQRATGQAAQSTTRRYSYGPTTANGSVRSSYSPSYSGSRQQPSWRADRKILGTGY